MDRGTYVIDSRAWGLGGGAERSASKSSIEVGEVARSRFTDSQPVISEQREQVATAQGEKKAADSDGRTHPDGYLKDCSDGARVSFQTPRRPSSASR